MKEIPLLGKSQGNLLVADFRENICFPYQLLCIAIGVKYYLLKHQIIYHHSYAPESFLFVISISSPLIQGKVISELIPVVTHLISPEYRDSSSLSNY